jgi:hypothetical protein
MLPTITYKELSDSHLAARFLLILRRGRLCCGFWLTAMPGRKPQRPNQSVYKNGWPLTATKLKKSSVAVCKASPEQCLRNAGKRANFSAAKNLPFRTSNPRRLQRLGEKEILHSQKNN